MSKNQVMLLVGCMVVGAAVLLSLFQFSPINSEIQHSSFNRIFAQNSSPSVMRQIDLKVNSFYFSGATDNTIYLGNWTGPFHFIEVELPTLDTTHFNVRIEGIPVPADYEVFRAKVDSPYFYLTHGVLPGILKGSLDRRVATKEFNILPPFVEAVPINQTSIALRCYSRSTKAYELAALKIDTPYFEIKPELLEKQVDGIFCEEGTLHYNKALNKLTYLYSYRNEFFTMDTTLTLINRFHTIDTFSRAHIKVAHVKSGNYSTLASPPVRTNGLSCVYGNNLFIQSAFLAKNEDRQKFMTASVIDVYDLNTGAYIHSFYLNNFHGNQLSGFVVTANCLAAIYDHHLILFEMPSIQ